MAAQREVRDARTATAADRSAIRRSRAIGRPSVSSALLSGPPPLLSAVLFWAPFPPLCAPVRTRVSIGPFGGALGLAAASVLHARPDNPDALGRSTGREGDSLAVDHAWMVAVALGQSVVVGAGV